MRRFFFYYFFFVLCCCVHKIGIGVSTLKCQPILDAWMVQQYGDVVCVSQLLLLYAETHGCLYLFNFFLPSSRIVTWMTKMPSLCRLHPTNSNKWFRHCEPFKHFFEIKQRCRSVKTTIINGKLGGAPSETITQRADEILMCENICGTRVAILHSLLLNQAVMLIV